MGLIQIAAFVNRSCILLHLYPTGDRNKVQCYKEQYCIGTWNVRSMSQDKFGSVQFSSVTQSSLTLCDPMNHSTPGLPVHHQLPESTQTHIHWVSDAIQPSHPLLSPSLALNLSQHRGLSNESALLIRWPKYWSCSFNISPSNEHPGLTSFRMDWLDLLAVLLFENGRANEIIRY